VSVASSSTLSAAPGTVATAVFKIHNRRAEARTVTVATALPAGWEMVTSVSPLTLPPNESVVRLVSVAVPKQAAVATHSIRLTATGAGDASPTATGRVDVKVTPVRRLALQRLDQPTTVSAGASYTARFALTSKSNVPLTVRLDAESSRQLRTRIAPQSTRLAPWATTEVVVTVRTRATARPFRHRLTLRARTADGAHATETQSTVEVVPVAGAGPNDAPTYPVAVRLQSVGDATGAGQQVEVRGSGPLTTDGAHAVDVFVRTPSAATLSGFGRRDRYQVAYTSDALSVRAGDHVYRQTPLTETGRLGLGAGGSYQRGAWTVGGHALRARYGGTARQAAGFVGVEAHERLELRGTVLQNAGLYDGTFASVQGLVTPWADATLAVEGGAGHGANGEGVSYRAELEGEHDWGTYRVRHLRAGAGVPTTTRDVKRTSAHAVVRATSNFVLDGTYRRLERGLSPQSLFSYASAYGQVGARVSGQWDGLNWNGSLYGVHDRAGDRTTQSLDAQGHLRWDWFGVRGSAEAGQVSFAGGPDGAYRAYDLQLSVRTRPFSISGGVDYEVEPDRTQPRSATRRSVHLAARAHLTGRTQLALQGQWSGSDASTFGGYRSVSGRLEHQFRFGHRLALDARSNRFTDAPLSAALWSEVPSYRVSYTVPVGLPIVQERTEGTLEGQIVDAETGAGVADALVRFGDTERYTDDTGRFTLPHARDDARYLRLDRASIGLHRVPMMPMPLEVDPERQASPIVVPVTRSAALTARVVLYDHPTLRAALGGEPPAPADSLSQVVVELADDRGRQRRLTGTDGTAVFDDLRPGTWTLRLVNPSLPESHTPAQPSHTISLSPGATDSLTVRIMPRTPRAQRSNVATEAPRSDSTRQGEGAPSSPPARLTLSSPAPSPSPPSSAPARPGTHVVEQVEWLAQLSRKYYGTLYCWTVIWEANRGRIEDPDELRPGMTLEIPPDSACTIDHPGPPIPDSLRPSVQRRSLSMP
jgi:hypothetical protein